jgi:hypothetical protein
MHHLLSHPRLSAFIGGYCFSESKSRLPRPGNRPETSGAGSSMPGRLPRLAAPFSKAIHWPTPHIRFIKEFVASKRQSEKQKANSVTE